MRPNLPLWFALLVGLLSVPTLAQTATPSPTPPVRDPQAIAFANSALATLIGAASIKDVTLTGSATRIAGSDVQTGTATLKALGITDSRMDLSLSDGVRSEIFSPSSDGTPQGSWIGVDRVSHQMASFNCLAGKVWFFPALSVLSEVSNPNFAVSYVGQEILSGESVQHIRVFNQTPNVLGEYDALLAAFSATDIYLNSSSYVPVALIFNTHPDNASQTNIPIEVDFSNYQSVNGVQVPFRIRRLVNGSLFLDLTIQNVILNSGLATSDFAE